MAYRESVLALSIALSALVSLGGCDEKDEPVAVEKQEPVAEPAPMPAPAPKAPIFAIDEISPKVGFSRVVLDTPEGTPKRGGHQQLIDDLTAEKEWISEKDVTVEIDRKAKPRWVALYLRAVGSLEPSAIHVATETRAEYPKKVAFESDATLDSVPPCTLVGTITDDRGTAIWRVSGGTARKRGRGMGGPDLTMTGDTILSMAKNCDSELFVVTGPKDLDWGMIYDLAAAGISLEEAGLERAMYPEKELTPGRAVR